MRAEAWMWNGIGWLRTWEMAPGAAALVTIKINRPRVPWDRETAVIRWTTILGALRCEGEAETCRAAMDAADVWLRGNGADLE